MKVGTAFGLSLKLAKAGWWNGDPGQIMKAPSDEVIGAIQYEGFLAEFEAAIHDLNKESA